MVDEAVVAELAVGLAVVTGLAVGLAVAEGDVEGRRLGEGEGGSERYSGLAVGLAVAEEGKIGTALVEDVLRRPVAMGYLTGPHLPVLGLWKSLSLFEHRLRWSVDSLVSHGYCPC